MILATLCYLTCAGATLMVHRNRKPGDMHEGKWNGLGGKLEPGESPEECVAREVLEESGLTIPAPRLRGLLTFPQFKGNDWLVFVYTADTFSGQLIDSPEGDLRWVKQDELESLPLWPSDAIFFAWMRSKRFFSAKFNYRGDELIDYQVAFHDLPPDTPVCGNGSIID